ncbi:hypothetical protein ACPA9J_16445 [Pseudomonas aeruginosa]
MDDSSAACRRNRHSSPELAPREGAAPEIVDAWTPRRDARPAEFKL